jgi:O-antigen/teichoic acid export membrane protein
MSNKRKVAQGAASNATRVALSTLIALVLPPMLVHRLSSSEYGAWVLILQCSGYAALLDLGLQTAVGKFVAEYDAKTDLTANARVLSSAFAILCISAAVGGIAIAVLCWQVPELFHQMPQYLVGNVRIGILAVGLSTVAALPFGAFLATFTGLQRYGFPTALTVTTKTLSSAALIVLLLMHQGLISLASALSLFNVGSALGQFIGWKRYIGQRVGFALGFVDRQMAIKLANYAGIISLWTVGTLFVSGLDTIIVGHYDFRNTGYYGISTSVVNFMVAIVGALFSPLMPAVSSLQSVRTPAQIGDLTTRATRYCTLLLCLFGMPFLVGAFPLLRLWVGNEYALRSALFLQVLVLGNVVRQIGLPYSVVVIATGKQHLATIASMAEAVVNFGVSIYLVQKIGAVGVAIGTLVGAFISVGLHLFLSMRLTSVAILIDRRSFVVQGILRPLLCAIPSFLLLACNRPIATAALSPWGVVWGVSSICIAWFLGLTAAERQSSKSAFRRLGLRFSGEVESSD